MNAIVNVNKSWGIGKDGDLLCYLPEDMRFFRETTKGKVVVMGRKTLESFPNAAPLAGRRNIVLTRDQSKIPASSWEKANADRANGKATKLCCAADLPALFAYLDDGAKNGLFHMDDVYVIGGAEIYNLLLPYCKKCFVTINDSQEKADTFFPDLSKLPAWKKCVESDVHEQNGITFRFTAWEQNPEKVQK